MPKQKKPALEVIFTTLHSGGKFERGKSYAVSGGLHGVGAAVVNALSSELIVQVKRDGERFEMRFERGETKGKLKKLGNARGTGTIDHVPSRRRRVRRQAPLRPRADRGAPRGEELPPQRPRDRVPRRDEVAGRDADVRRTRRASRSSCRSSSPTATSSRCRPAARSSTWTSTTRRPASASSSRSSGPRRPTT